MIRVKNQFGYLAVLISAAAIVSGCGKPAAFAPAKTTATLVVPADVDEKPAAAKRELAGDWPMWGGGINRNMYNSSTGLNIDFIPPRRGKDDVKKLLWTKRLGSQTYANPVIVGGKVFVGTNNAGNYRPNLTGDKGVALAFDAKTGDVLWQLTRDKLPAGRVNDWPEQGICSTPCVEGERMWVVTNRAELMCVDTEGYLDGENDGPITDEVLQEKEDADIIWSLDMIEELGVFPHNLATSSPVVYEDTIFVLTSNGVDEAHLEVPSPRSPGLIAVHKKTGKLIWEDNSPLHGILHGQWGSPAIGVVDGKAQVYYPGGDGWLYAFDVDGDGDGGSKLIWKFDLNPKDSVWELGSRGTRNAILSTPVFYENSVLLAVGQDPEHGEGVGHLYRIDATKTGDISPTIEDGADADGKPKYKDNPESGQIWQYGGKDEDGSVTGKKGNLIFRRTMSTVAIADGLVYAADLSGRLHCVDLKTGERYWEHDQFSGCWGSPMVVDGKVLIGDEDGDMTIFAAGKKLKKLAVVYFNSSVYSTPSIANGVIYITDRSALYAFSTE